MRKLILGSVALLALNAGSSALAADLAVKAPVYKAPLVAPVIYDWTGLYVGVNAGYGWGREAINLTGDPVTVGPGFLIPGGVPTSIAGNPKGFIGGGQIGYNYQTGQWLLGFEADFDGAN